ncbi:MAG: hypothetical protein KatS3mg059_1638 [Thermomicrobiales bacterium]|nr:MAG: hypothetical protein KatS3mg059_1638 [Thermomicrobiales bacterium]
MPFCRLFYHLVWTTKNREPLLAGMSAEMVERCLRATCQKHHVAVHALFVMPDHVHLAVSVPPTLAIATLVSLKGSSSHLLNYEPALKQTSFAWQAEYGALTFGERQLPDVVAYIENQPLRHATQGLWTKLEHTFESPSAGFSRVSNGSAGVQPRATLGQSAEES